MTEEGVVRNCATMFTVEKSIRLIFSPLLSVSYICGLRIVEFSAGHPRRLSFLYILLLWSVYCFLMIDKVMSYIPRESSPYKIYVLLNIFTALLSVLLAVYHDKKFRNCLRKLAVVDDTLEKIGTLTNYQKLRAKMTWIVLGWFMLAVLLNYFDYLRWRFSCYDVLTSVYLTFMTNYCSHINVISDLFFSTILGYIGIKFDQVNEHFHKLAIETTEGINETREACENSVVRSQQCSLNAKFFPSTNYVTWLLTHLHLELQKISRDVNSMFEVQMTIKVVCYFCFTAEFFRQLFTAIFVRKYYSVSKAILVSSIVIFWLAWYISSLLLINYMCEKISIKAKATGDIVSKITHCNAELRNNILQFLLQITQAPLRLYALGLFQFGAKFIYGYCESILSLMVILIQVDEFKHTVKHYELC